MASGGKVVVKIDGDAKGFKESFDKLKGFAGKAAKGIAIGVGAVATSIGAIGTAAVKSFADYEQLVGGIETLFGTGGQTLEEYAASTKRTTEEASKDYEKLTATQEKMLKKAHGAFETAGMSANTYMETATGFAASLVSSLGGDTAKAADYADRAMVDMSDNANKMGTNLEMIQNAYQGFAKQNYTMLDNLKLGYGGTKEEMQRLIKDAAKMTDTQKELGVSVDANSMSFGNIVNAISVMQSSMGIAGTTAKEATTTITGSLNMAKAAWDNLMVALADKDGNVEEAIGDLLYSVEAVANNMMPVISTVLDKIPGMLDTLGGIILQKLPELISTILPSVIQAAGNLLSVFTTTLNDNASSLTDVAMNAATMLVNGFSSNAPQLLQTAITVMLTFIQGLSETLPQLIPVAIDAILQLVDTLLNNIGSVIDAGIQLILGLAEGIMNALPMIAEKGPTIIINLFNALIEAGPKLATAAVQLIIILAKGLIQALPQLIMMVPRIIIALAQALINYGKKMLEVGKNLVQGIWEGFKGAFSGMIEKIKGLVDKIPESIKKILGIHSPSTVMRDKVGIFIAQGLAVGMDKGMGNILKSINRIKTKILNGFADVAETCRDRMTSMLNDLIADNRSNVQKALDDMNQVLLKSEEKYNAESERLKDSKSDSDKEYLEKLKDVADKERKVYDALQKDIEENKKAVVSTFTEIAKAAYKNIEDVQKAQETMRKKLSGYGDLFTKGKITTGTGDIDIYELSSFKEQNAALEEYADILEQLKGKGEIPKELFESIRDMSIDEGSRFAKMLVGLSDKKFDEYIQGWQEKQELADKIAKQLYIDEAKEAKDSIEKAFTEAGEDFERQGEDNAIEWGDGFISSLKEILPKLKAEISTSIGALFGSDLALSGAAAGNNYNVTYVVTPSKGESTVQQLKAIRDNETLNNMRGGF